MKRKLYLLPFFLLIMLLQTACSSDDTFFLADKEFDVNTTSLSFPARGGEQIISITSDKEIDWNAYSSISWIKIGEPNYATGTISIIAEPNNEIDQTTGTVTVYATPGDSKKIQVTRAGLGIIHDRSSLSRMNLRGDISKLSYYLNPTHIFEVAFSELTDLRFNENGMLIGFVNKFMFSEELDIIYTNTLTYDSQNRLTQLKAIGDAIVEDTGEMATHVLDFTYGNHGKYIDTQLLGNHLKLIFCNSDLRVWLPKMIKDLAKIKIYSNGFEDSPDSSIDIEITGDEGTCNFTYTESGTEEIMLLALYSFDGSFLRQMMFQEFFMGYPAISTNDYLIDAKSGNILSVIKTADMFGEEILSHETFTKDITNQRLYYFDIFIGYDLTVEFNDKMDIVKMDNATGFESFGEFEYMYDKKGNWTNIKATNLITGHIGELNKTRTIGYIKK